MVGNNNNKWQKQERKQKRENSIPSQCRPSELSSRKKKKQLYCCCCCTNPFERRRKNKKLRKFEERGEKERKREFGRIPKGYQELLIYRFPPSIHQWNAIKTLSLPLMTKNYINSTHFNDDDDDDDIDEGLLRKTKKKLPVFVFNFFRMLQGYSFL